MSKDKNEKKNELHFLPKAKKVL